MPPTTRRHFFDAGLGALTTLLTQGPAPAASTPAGVPIRILGRTNVAVSIIGLGGWHIGVIKDEHEAVRILHAAVDEGVTFFDNCWDYHDGHAEEVMGKALAMDNRRKRVFLMTKTCERDHDGALKNLDDSLRRLRTDYIDLWQFHECIYDNDPEWIFERGGIQAALEARRQGKIRFIGFSGHKDPRIHLDMLSRPHDWDTAQMPINVMDAHYRSFQREVVPACAAKDVGIIGMKGLGGGYPEGRFNTKAGVSVEECYRYALSTPVAVQVLGVTSMQQLEQNIGLARAFKPMTPEQKRELLARVKDSAGDGRHELYKSTQEVDSPTHRKQHSFSN